ncbi:MAG TPA: CBS domain-containing protein [Candidatus Limnocylindrales bacterium]|jgi:CBS domain-containing protein|nr:CBS domain-containing protein [Candidatus Limnocylindrales bacterium]
MTAAELMTRKFEIVHADACLEEVARKLESSDIDHLPVCKDGLLVGMITQEEVAVRGSAANRRAERTRVGDVIAPDVVFCFENTEVDEAASLMKENRVSLLPVLSRTKKVVGVLALKDIPGEREPGPTQPR